MSKIIKLTEKDLTNIVKRVMSEEDYSTDIERPTSDRERQVKSLFGDKYGSYIPNDVIRYIRKNPSQFFKKLYQMYGDAAYDYLDKAKNKGGINFPLFLSNIFYYIKILPIFVQ